MAKVERSFTITEVAKKLNVSYPTVKGLMDTGALGFRQITPNMCRITEAHLADYLEAAERPAKSAAGTE